MTAYIVRRLFSTIVVMAVVAFVVFSLLYLTPGDPAAVIAGDIATDEDIRLIHARLGLDEPFLVQFGRWVWALLHGDLGISARHITVSTVGIVPRMDELYARTKAQALAAASGLHVGGVRSVEETGSTPITYDARAVPAPSTPIVAGSQEITASVTVVFDAS